MPYSYPENRDIVNYPPRTGQRQAEPKTAGMAGKTTGPYSGPDGPSGEELPVPHSAEAEEAVLGSLLIDRDTISTVAPILKPEHFFSRERASLYRALLELYTTGTPADLVTVRTELKALGVLGEGEGQVRPAYLLALMRKTPSPVHACHYAGIVFKHYLARELIRECSRTINQACQKEGMIAPLELLAAHSRRLQALEAKAANLHPAYFLSHEESLDFPLRLEKTPSELSLSGRDESTSSEVDPWDRVSSSGSAIQNDTPTGAQKRPGLRFGWAAFDGVDWTEPPRLALLPATLTTILARTGGGKTIAAMQIADTNAEVGLNVLYFHVELNREQMLARRYCRLTGVPVLYQLLGRLSDEQRAALLKASDEVMRWTGRVDFVHCPNWKIERVVSELRARHFALVATRGQGYDLVVLDYLQRLGRPEGHYAEHEALAANVRGFSDAANELNIAALMASQVSRTTRELSDAEPPSLDEGLGTGDIERCSNQLVALAINGAKTAARYAVRKHTFGEGGYSGELPYNPHRLAFL
ncbi:MAG TPA: DnaB-like helicase N-terminal domain-containing protein [Chloroflexia bacterium]|nr:DnaB-like helicase N-terminal domain-containing protein [Chloroflexia bacterium]